MHGLAVVPPLTGTLLFLSKKVIFEIILHFQILQEWCTNLAKKTVCKNTVKLQIFVQYPFSYFWLETGLYELIFVLSRASKQNYIEIRWPQDKNKFSSGIKFRTFFKSMKLSTVRKFVTLQYLDLTEIRLRLHEKSRQEILCVLSFFFFFFVITLGRNNLMHDCWAKVAFLTKITSWSLHIKVQSQTDFLVKTVRQNPESWSW